MNIEHIYRAWRYRLKLDKKEIKYLLANIKKNDVVIDIGAHKGAYTYWMRRCVKDQGKVIVFEPQIQLASYLKKQYEQYPNVIIENKAVSSFEIEKTLYIPDKETSPSASFNQHHADMMHSEFKKETKVLAVTLDNYVKENAISAVRFIKCDVEGHELEVFQGAKKVLTQQRPILLFECENRHQKQRCIADVFLYLKTLKYQGYFFYGRKLRSIDYFDMKNYQSGSWQRFINNFIFEPIL